MNVAPAVTPRQIRLAAATFAASVLAVATLGLVLWLATRELQSEYVAKAQLLDSLRQNRTASAGKTASPATQSAAILAATETLAASELQKQIVERAMKAGGAVRSAQAEVTREAATDGLQRLVARLNFDSSIATLQALLFDLETGVPFIFVDALAVQPAAASAAEMNADDRLQVTLVLSSYWTSSATGQKHP